MVSMLVPLLLASAGTGPSATEPVALSQRVEVWLDTRVAYERGEHARVHVRAHEDGFLLVLHADAAGRVRVLFPIDPYIDDFVRGGETLEVRGRGDREAFLVDERSGTGFVLAAWSRDPFRFDGFVLGDHWDYHALSPIRGVDAEADLLDLAGRMAAGPFDYDVAEYIVDPAAPYRRSPVRVTTWYDYDPLCFGCAYRRPFSRSGFFFNVGFGTFGSHIAFGYGSAFPIVRPIWYRPYRPIWYRPVYYVPYYARPYRVRPIWAYHHHHHGFRPRWSYYRWPYYDRSGFGVRVRYAGSSYWDGAFYGRDRYVRSRSGTYTRVSDRPPVDRSGRATEPRRAAPRNDPAPSSAMRRAAMRNDVGRPNDASTRTPVHTTRVRPAEERGATERRATPPTSNGDPRAARPRLIRDDVRSGEVRPASPRQAAPRTQPETRPRASARSSSERAAWERAAQERAAQERAARSRSTATRPASSSSRVERAERPMPSTRSSRAAVRPAASSSARSSSRPSASSRSRPSARPAPASGSTRPRAAPASRSSGSGKAQSRSSRGRGGKKKR